MAAEIKFTPNKTYATRANALKAVEKAYGPIIDVLGGTDLNFLMVQTEEGRFFPVFIGERALRHGVHFKFCVAA